jgi:pimeloyl-ACP methyl ester carboxylesterase
MNLINALLFFVRWILIARGVESHLTDVQGNPFHYYEYNPHHNQIPIVLVHGLGSTANHWGKVIFPLAEKYHVYAPDLPGTGKSKLPTGKTYYRLSEYTDALSSWISQTFDRPVILVGQSLGAWIAVKVALEHPEKVQQLVFVNGAGIRYPGMEEIGHLFTIKTKEDVDQFVDHMWYKPPQMMKWMSGTAIEAMNRPILTEFIRTLEEKDFLNGELKKLEKTPTMVIWGVHDRLISAATVDTIQQHLPHVQIVRMEQCGHIPQLEQPEAFSRILLDLPVR